MTMLEWRARYDQQLRYGYNMLGYRREVTRHLVRYVSLGGEKGYVLWSNPGKTSSIGSTQSNATWNTA